MRRVKFQPGQDWTPQIRCTHDRSFGPVTHRLVRCHGSLLIVCLPTHHYWSPEPRVHENLYSGVVDGRGKEANR